MSEELMEGRFMCCGKLAFAGHSHDCPDAVKRQHCGRCDGTGMLAAWDASPRCTTCNGTGMVPPEVDQ